MKKLFLSTLLLALPLLANAYGSYETSKIDGIYYRVYDKDKVAEVTYKDHSGYPSYQYTSDYSGAVVIPEKIKYKDVDYPVVSIGDHAFIGCTGLTSVTIPKTVKNIGELAFSGCTGLISVHISDLEAWCKISFNVDDYGQKAANPLSYANHLYLNGEEITDLVIPNTVTSISSQAFYGFRGLTSVTISNSVASIGDYAFAYCTGLPSVSIPNSVTEIGNYAFANCTGLTSVSIPNSVTTIRDHAFANCTGLTSMSIPNSVTEIGSYAFYKCTGLTSVTIPNSVTYIGRAAFYNCRGLTSVTLPNSLYSIQVEAFAYSGLTSISIPNSVEKIGMEAFRCCYNLNSVTIPNSVWHIGDNAFYNCMNLATLVSKIESPFPHNEDCFRNCYGATLYVPKGTIEKYRSTNYWCWFTKIVEGSPFEHTLTYIVDGKTYKTYIIEEGDLISPENEPSKKGYTFSGWSETPETMPANDVTVTGTFTINKYKLTYIVDGEEYKSLEIEYKSAITPEEIPIKEGYTFSGWSTIPKTMPANDVTITGTFTVNKYKLTYNIDGVEYKLSEVDYGTALTPEEAPVKEGYTFSGWSEIPETMPARDVVVTGKYTINKYKLNYMVDGVGYKSEEVEYGATITPETAPTKEGYTFSGWSDIPSTMPSRDITITGSFTVNKYNLTYIVDGVDYKTTQIEYGSAITPEAIPTKEGYTFSGWSDIPETMPASDVTITGTFTVNKYKLTYMVDGVEYKSYEVEFGATITPEASPANEGQTFSGWSEIPTTMPANDVVITGTFSDNSYKLTYMVDGEVFKSSHIEYGSTITPETPPTKEGYTFSGWSEIPTTMPASDVTISGTFTPNKYKLTYTVDGVEYKTAEVDCGAAITPEDNPTKEGYTFSGWSEIPETMPASDVTITGTFTINTYTITYMVDNALLMTEEVTYGSTITPPVSPKEGYEITWNSHPTTMPAYDVTIYGSYISTGINGIYAEESDKKVYTPDGKRIQSPKKGMNIIRMSDGTLKKVVVM